jgi:hypothetical protein
LWVADAGGSVLRLDPETRTIARTVPTGSVPVGLAAADGRLWATGGASPAAHSGGTLRAGWDRGLSNPPLTGSRRRWTAAGVTTIDRSSDSRTSPARTGASEAGAWTGPDLAQAQRLVAASGTRGARVVVWPTTSASVWDAA